jgi:hypothetical protein
LSIVDDETEENDEVMDAPSVAVGAANESAWVEHNLIDLEEEEGAPRVAFFL